MKRFRAEERGLYHNREGLPLLDVRVGREKRNNRANRVHLPGNTVDNDYGAGGFNSGLPHYEPGEFCAMQSTS